MVLLPLSKKVLAANIVLPILATIAVVLRFAARKTTRSSLKADDYVILLALVKAPRMDSEASVIILVLNLGHCHWDKFFGNLRSCYQHLRGADTKDDASKIQFA